MKILIAEDDPAQRRLLQVHLRRVGFEVVEAVDGLIAWEIWQREHYRLVITDWMMPGIDGPGLIRRIRNDSHPHYTYIILLTAKDTKTDVVEGLDAGADDYLVKPFNAAELRARVSNGKRILDLEGRLSESLLQVQQLATRDGLTGLFNRRAFDERLADEVQRSRRYSRSVSLIMADIDHFKLYNDTNGHPQGDWLLRELAGLLVDTVRSTDFVARYGGEEFAIILTETDKKGALTLAEKIRQRVATHSFPKSECQPGGKITLSLGVASYPEDLPDGSALVERADKALYQAKHSGRNRVAG